MKNKNLNNVIEALSRHEDNSAVEVLTRIGTNSHDDEVRRLTAKALITRNSNESLSVVILEKGKGINDLSVNVAMSTINELLSLKNKTEANEILSRAQEMDLDEEIRENARSVQALMAFS